jgi:hypothetical protein
MLALAKLKIELLGDEAHTTVSVDGKKWRKKYESRYEASKRRSKAVLISGVV